MKQKETTRNHKEENYYHFGAVHKGRRPFLGGRGVQIADVSMKYISSNKKKGLIIFHQNLLVIQCRQVFNELFLGKDFFLCFLLAIEHSLDSFFLVNELNTLTMIYIIQT